MTPANDNLDFGGFDGETIRKMYETVLLRQQKEIYREKERNSPQPEKEGSD